MEDYNIYPKQFRNAKIPIEKNRCFILMPFDEKLDGIYGNVKKALNDNGYVCNRADEILGSKPIMNKVLNEILKSQFIIADLTNQNPNVFYELGIAHTFKDAQNIILITQKVQDIPFDLRHINNIVYNPENIKYLTSNIIQTLADNRYLVGFQEALQQRNIINIIHDNQDEFISYLQSQMNELVPQFSKILFEQHKDYDEKDVETVLNRIITIINDVIKNGYIEYLKGIIKVFFDTLMLCSKYSISDKIAYDFLFGNMFIDYKMNEEEITSYKIDLAIVLASNGIKINMVMSWLIDYLSRSKSATIDLNRYKVERFLMVTNDEVINNILVDSIFHKNSYIREHVADIVGEKKLLDSRDALLAQLVVEENYFTAVSIISAIGKLTVKEGGNSIMIWLEENKADILKTNQLFVLKHSHVALTRIDKKYGTKYLDDFERKYASYIKNYFIL